MAYELVPNPAFTGPPRIIEAACHDRTPFLTVVCSGWGDGRGGCGNEMHLHESQIEHISGPISSQCSRCLTYLRFPPRFFHDAFEKMRADGWLAPRSS